MWSVLITRRTDLPCTEQQLWRTTCRDILRRAAQSHQLDLCDVPLCSSKLLFLMCQVSSLMAIIITWSWWGSSHIKQPWLACRHCNDCCWHGHFSNGLRLKLRLNNCFAPNPLLVTIKNHNKVEFCLKLQWMICFLHRNRRKWFVITLFNGHPNKDGFPQKRFPACHLGLFSFPPLLQVCPYLWIVWNLLFIKCIDSQV